MAIVFSSFLKKLKGKIGNLIFYESRGQVRIRGNGMSGIVPKTPSQQLQQARLRTAVAFYRANAGSALPHIWRVAAHGKVMSGYNLFLRCNMAVFNREYRICDYSQLHVSRGRLEFPQSLRLANYEKGKIYLEWRNILPSTSVHMSDRLHAVWLDGNGDFSLHVPALSGVLRRDEQAVLSLPEAGNKDLHLYVYFSDNEEKQFSPDKYFYLPAIE